LVSSTDFQNFKMQFIKFIVAAATVAVATAQSVAFTNSNFGGIKAGTPFNITWSGATSDITLKLKTGPASAQQFVSTIASKSYGSEADFRGTLLIYLAGVTGSSYLWTPPSSVVDGQLYNLEIDHGTDAPNYSQQFPITGGTGVASASTMTVTGASTSTATVASTTITSSSGSSSTGSSSASSASGSSTSKASSSGSSTASSTASKTSILSPHFYALYHTYIVFQAHPHQLQPTALPNMAHHSPFSYHSPLLQL
jgi:hypothetical protein